MMRISNEAHQQREWRVHRLADDFDLHDVWRFPIEGGADDFPRFVAMHEAGFETMEGGNRISAFLFALRAWLGRVFGWDDAEPLPIPGCIETHVRDRLPLEERSSGGLSGPFERVYLFGAESLYELQNRTVHALLHLGWVEDGGRYAPEMAVYVKPRGWFGRMYMRLIDPFRYWIVYPALMGQVRRQWQAEQNL